MVVETPNPAKTSGHVSRVAITNSREDLTSARALSPELPSPRNLDTSYRKKSVTKINIGPGILSDASAQHSRSKSDADERTSVHKSTTLHEDVTKTTTLYSDVTNERKSTLKLNEVVTNKASTSVPTDVSSIDNNNVIPSTKSKSRTISSSSDHSKIEPSLSIHSLVDKRGSNSSSTTTTSANVSKASSVALSGSYHHLHHLSEVKLIGRKYVSKILFFELLN
jgi:hypothetical protein